ncbi:MAG: hypothetical protein DMG00_30895 [Acidobacteria bacterium]|nr:MAG: hypothetical protein DMG00_30895 [Acidobacteriota bacterium]
MSRSRASSKFRQSRTTTSRSSTSRRCRKCRSAVAAARSRPQGRAPFRPAGLRLSDSSHALGFGIWDSNPSPESRIPANPESRIPNPVCYTPRVPKLSVTVITKNEAADIDDALASVSFADEIVVVDAFSTDETVRIAKRHTDRVIVRDWPGYIDQKNYAASIARYDWILSLDADERVTQELAGEIRSLMSGAPREMAYRIPRVTFHLGRWIRTTDWYPDYQLRLYDRRAAQWTGRYVHEAVTVRGEIGRLRGELQHYAYRDISDHLETMAVARACCTSQGIPRSRFFATTSPVAASATAFPGSSFLR